MAATFLCFFLFCLENAVLVEEMTDGVASRELSRGIQCVICIAPCRPESFSMYTSATKRCPRLSGNRKLFLCPEVSLIQNSGRRWSLIFFNGQFSARRLHRRRCWGALLWRPMRRGRSRMSKILSTTMTMCGR